MLRILANPIAKSVNKCKCTRKGFADNFFYIIAHHVTNHRFLLLLSWTVSTKKRPIPIQKKTNSKLQNLEAAVEEHDTHKAYLPR